MKPVTRFEVDAGFRLYADFDGVTSVTCVMALASVLTCMGAIGGMRVWHAPSSRL
jgi:hypothetical protein